MISFKDMMNFLDKQTEKEVPRKRPKFVPPIARTEYLNRNSGNSIDSRPLDVAGCSSQIVMAGGDCLINSTSESQASQNHMVEVDSKKSCIGQKYVKGVNFDIPVSDTRCESTVSKSSDRSQEENVTSLMSCPSLQLPETLIEENMDSSFVTLTFPLPDHDIMLGDLDIDLVKAVNDLAGIGCVNGQVQSSVMELIHPVETVHESGIASQHLSSLDEGILFGEPNFVSESSDVIPDTNGNNRINIEPNGSGNNSTDTALPTKKFHCRKCGREFRIEKRRDKHEQTVNCVVASFSCSKCKKGFPKAAYLRTHVNRVCSKPQFKCDVCLAVFPTQKTLDKHIASYHTMKECSYCGHKYKNGNTLRSHMFICKSKPVKN